MSNQQLYVVVGAPFLTFLLVFIVSSITNRNAINDLRGEMQAGFSFLREEMQAGFTSQREEMRAGFEAVNKRIDDTNRRIDDGNRRIDELSERVSRVETKLEVLNTEIRSDHERRLATLEAHVLGKAS